MNITKPELDIDYIQFIVIDLFCGAGGTTIGFEKAETSYDSMYAFLKSIGIDPPRDRETFFKVSKVVACVNHDPIAIKSHWSNHPEIEHFEEDIRILDPYGRLKRLIEIYRACYPHAKIILWASLECTNFSKAKGGEARDADSRTLALELYHYIHALDPDFVMIENVVEFMAWGPMIPKILRTKEGYESCLIKVKKKKNVITVLPGWVPESKKNGKDWMRWRKEINSFGYHDEWKQINCADLGARTSRNRLFGCFSRVGLPIVWPLPTHSKHPEKTSLTIPLQKWNPVKDVLDFDDEGESIFNRTLKDGTPDPLSTNTMDRLFKGAVKHIAGGKDKYGIKFFSGKPEHKNFSLDNPSPSITTFGGGALVKAVFIDQRNGGDPASKSRSVNEPAKTLTKTGGNQQLVTSTFITKGYSGKPDDKNVSVENPAPTITTKPHESLVTAKFVTKWNGTDKNTGEKHSGHSIEEPAPTITTQNRLGLATANFISKFYSRSGTDSSVDDPAGVVTTKDRMALTTFIDVAHSQGKRDQSIEQPLGAITTTTKESLVFLDKQYGGADNHQSIEQPAGVIMKNDKHSLIKAEKFIMDTQYKNIGSSLEDPAPTITANRKHHYIINPSWFGNTSSIDEPCHVVIARQDKAPLGLITCKEGPLAIPFYDDDCEWTIKLKEFMVLYGICDIKMRMLKVIELKEIQGFPKDYILLGNQTDQKKFIGNAVHHYVPRKWIEAFSDRMIQHNFDLKLAA